VLNAFRHRRNFRTTVGVEVVSRAVDGAKRLSASKEFSYESELRRLHYKKAC